MHGFGQVLIVAALVMGLAHTVAKERLFAPLRERCGGKTTWLGYLLSCPYCASHWIAFVIVPMTGTYAVPVVPELGPLAPVARWFLSSVFVAVLAAFMRVGFYLFDEEQGLVRRRKELVEKTVAKTPPVPDKPGKPSVGDTLPGSH
jgi:Protein of unknown function (DUF1360)